jgi:hypothetical protein
MACLRVFALTTALLLAVVGCRVDVQEGDEDYVAVRHGAAVLYVHPGDGSCELVNGVSKRVVDGDLTAEQMGELKALGTPELQAVYLQHAAADAAACMAAGGYTISPRGVASGCFVVEQVSEPRTLAMLAFFAPLFDRYQAASELPK